MRASTFSSLAVLVSSLLVKDVLAGRYDVRKRALVVEVVTDNVIVTEVVRVTKHGDGSYHTGAPEAVGTLTIGVTVPQTQTPTPSPSSATPSTTTIQISEPSPPASSSSTSASASPSIAGAAFIQEAVAVAAPSTTAAAVPAAVPTTLATVASPAATAGSSSSSSSSGGKRGLSYNDPTILSQLASSSLVSWAYNWGSSSPSIPSSLEYVPMLWGTGAEKVTPWSNDASSAIAAGSTHLLSFNEPDLPAQSNLSPGDAAQGYQTHMQPFAGKAKLGAPATTNGAAPMGLTWLGNFLNSCSGCTIDFVPIHWYDLASNVDYFKSYVQDAYAAGGNRPIWITEFGATGSLDEQNTFLNTVLPWLDSLGYVERYAYFMAADGILLNSGSSPSTLGKTFASGS